MPALIDLTGKRYGKWLVLGRSESTNLHPKWLCLCDCGVERSVCGSNLRYGLTTSCGCGHGRHLHARAKAQTSEYLCWRNMRQRCENPNWPQYRHYGGRGITVCERWTESFDNFLADMGLKPSPDLTLERVDNSRGYSPDNCIWATFSQQNQNKRSRAQVREDERSYYARTGQ